MYMKSALYKWYYHYHSNIIITLSIIEKLTPCWSWNSVFAPMAPCLFSSQVPLSFLLDGTLKFVEVHQEFLKHEWLQDIKLGDSKCSATCPWSRWFSRVVRYAERNDKESSSAPKTIIFTIPWNRAKTRAWVEFITSEGFLKCEIERPEYVMFVEWDCSYHMA